MQTTHAHRDINVYTPDVKSIITGFGKHNRALAFLPRFDEEFGKITLYARVDHVNGLRDPNESEILAIAHKDQGVKGNFNLIEKTTWNEGRCTDYHFELVA